MPPPGTRSEKLDSNAKMWSYGRYLAQGRGKNTAVVIAREITWVRGQ